MSRYGAPRHERLLDLRAGCGAGEHEQGDDHRLRVAVSEGCRVRADVPLEPLLHTDRIGHAVVLVRFFVLLEELNLSPAQRRSATLIGSKYLFAYVDRVVGEVSEVYTAEREGPPGER